MFIEIELIQLGNKRRDLARELVYVLEDFLSNHPEVGMDIKISGASGEIWTHGERLPVDSR